jgi:hypothetical protein
MHCCTTSPTHAAAMITCIDCCEECLECPVTPAVRQALKPTIEEERHNLRRQHLHRCNVPTHVTQRQTVDNLLPGLSRAVGAVHTFLEVSPAQIRIINSALLIGER